MVFAGVPVGAANLLGGEVFRPEMAVANFGPKPAHVSVSYSSTTAAQPQVREVATLVVNPGTVEAIHLPELNGDPGMRNSFTVASDAPLGAVISNLIARGQQMYPAVQLIGKDAQDMNNGGVHPWTIANGDQSTLLLFNHAEKPILFNVNIAASGITWHEEYQLAPWETRAVDIREVITKQLPDLHGKVLAPSATIGEASWFTPDHGDGTGRLIVTNPQAGLARNFSCGNNIVLCGAGLYNDFAGLVLGFDGYLGDVYGNFCTAWDPNACSGQQYDSGGGNSYYWQSGSNAISPISGSNTNTSATFYGNSTGSTYGMGTVYTSTCGMPATGNTSVTSYTAPQHNHPNAPITNGCRVSTCFDCIINHTTGAKHRAQDVVGTNIAVGTPVYAAEAGTVTVAIGGNPHINQPASTCAGKGYAADYVDIKSTSDGAITRYVHVTPIISKGTLVTAGQQIGTVDISGCTSGPHVHMNRKFNAVVVNFTIPCNNSQFDSGDSWYDDSDGLDGSAN